MHETKMPMPRASERARGGEEGGRGGEVLKLLLLVRLEAGGMACMMGLGTEFIDVT